MSRLKKRRELAPRSGLHPEWRDDLRVVRALDKRQNLQPPELPLSRKNSDEINHGYHG